MPSIQPRRPLYRRYTPREARFSPHTAKPEGNRQQGKKRNHRKDPSPTCKICDLLVPGSPTSSTLISPLYLGPPPPPPLATLLLVPPNSCNKIPFFTSSIPQIDGASDLDNNSYKSGRRLSSVSFASNSALRVFLPPAPATPCSSSSSSAPSPTPPTPGSLSPPGGLVLLSN